ncbi:MAG TPA: succinic semialdehyde dehydrogenase [Candidatus Binatia bacterium]|nr:succinic semialdehyde dehydrogenase [Candidatus Binatia bacterium]
MEQATARDLRTFEATPPERATWSVESPATGDKVADVTSATHADVEAAVARAREAQRAWAALGFAERRKILIAARAELVQRKDEVIDLLCAETGKPRADALTEIFALCDVIGYYAKHAEKMLRDQHFRPHLLANKKAIISYKPRGVVGVISPWNFPVLLSYWDGMPAVIAGNACVIKPSEVTPLAVERTRDLLVAGGLPTDLLQVVQGKGDVGAWLIDEVDMICFTGSVATGKKVMARAAETLTPVQLELGGKDPMIVLKDADLERAANAAVWGGLFHSGQVCMSVERVYVEEPVAREFTAKVIEKVKQVRQGVERDAGQVDIGAMTFAPQVEKIERHLADAREKGAQIAVGGRARSDLPGRFFEPTVVTDVNHDMELMRDETFGPVIPIMRVRDEEEALRLANDSPYGLSSSVFTRDKEHGVEIAKRIEAGTAVVNDCLIGAQITEVPFGGVKDSGIGGRNGPDFLKKYCHAQSIVVDRFGTKKEPNWYPTPAWVGKALDRGLRFFYGRKPRR